MVAAPMTLLIPGAGPPPTKMAIRLSNMRFRLAVIDRVLHEF
jgi:hypothetical protein